MFIKYILFVVLFLCFFCDDILGELYEDKEDDQSTQIKSTNIEIVSSNFDQKQINQSKAMLFDDKSKTLSLCLDRYCHSDEKSPTVFLSEIKPTSIDLKFKFGGYRQDFDFQNNQFARSVFISIHDITDYSSQGSSYDDFKDNIINDTFLQLLPDFLKPQSYFQDNYLNYSEKRYYRDYPYFYHMVYRDIDKSSSSSSPSQPDLSDLPPEQILEFEVSDFDQDRGSAGYQMLKHLPLFINTLRSSDVKLYLANMVILFNADELLKNSQSEDAYSIGQDIVDAWNSLKNDHLILFVAMYDQSNEEIKNQWNEFFSKILPQVDQVQKVSLSVLDQDLSNFRGLSNALITFHNSMEYCALYDVKTNLRYVDVSERKLEESRDNYYSSGAEDEILIMEDILQGEDPASILKGNELKINNKFCCDSPRGEETSII